MRRFDLALAVVTLCAVVLSGVAVSTVLDRNVSIVEFLFIALPTVFVLTLCWQASKYYIVVSEDPTAEWETPVQPENEHATTTEAEPDDTHRITERSGGYQDHSE